MHISELATHHVENPREVVSQGDEVSVRIIEIDADRRRLSLSLKRVSDQGGSYEDGDAGEYDDSDHWDEVESGEYEEADSYDDQPAEDGGDTDEPQAEADAPVADEVEETTEDADADQAPE